MDTSLQHIIGSLNPVYVLQLKKLHPQLVLNWKPKETNVTNWLWLNGEVTKVAEATVKMAQEPPPTTAQVPFQQALQLVKAQTI